MIKAYINNVSSIMAPEAVNVISQLSNSSLVVSRNTSPVPPLPLETPLLLAFSEPGLQFKTAVNSYSLLPLLVIALIIPPVARPNSAKYPPVLT